MERDIKMKIVIFWLIVSLLIPYKDGFCETPEEYRVTNSELNLRAAELNLNRVTEALNDFRSWIFCYQIATFFYHQHAQVIDIINTMHSMHKRNWKTGG